jgi:hypothetical protein
MTVKMTRRACTALLAQSLVLPAIARAELSGQHPRLRRGINFHHVANWPLFKQSSAQYTYVWPPFAAPSYQISDEELRRLTSVGFDFVRMTVDPSILIATDEAQRAQVFGILKDRLRRIMAANLNVIFDLHPVQVNPAYAPLKLVASRDGAPFRAYVDLIARAVDEMKDMPFDRFVFEIMNEPWLETPAEIDRWPAMLAELHARARAASPNMPLILTGAYWSDRKPLMKLDLSPYRQSNVIYTFHYYDPHTYTHQGYTSDDTRYIAGLDWPPSPDNIAIVRTASLARAAADPKVDAATRSRLIKKTNYLLDVYGQTRHGPDIVHADFAEVANWARANGISADRIVLGEFGGIATSNGIRSPGRTKWIETVRRAAEDFGFPWAFWDYKDSGGFGLADASGKTLDVDVLRALGLRTPQAAQ